MEMRVFHVEIHFETACPGDAGTQIEKQGFRQFFVEIIFQSQEKELQVLITRYDREQTGRLKYDEFF